VLRPELVLGSGKLTVVILIVILIVIHVVIVVHLPLVFLIYKS